MFGSIKDSYILLFTSMFNQFQYVFVEVYEENMISDMYLEKGGAF